MEQSENKLYGEKIRNYLQNNGITFVDFAKKVGTSQGALSNWISGARCAKRANVKAIARAMGCKISDISGYSDDPELIQEDFDFAVSANPQDFYDSVFSELCKDVSENGQAKVAETLGVSQSHIGDLYNKKTDIGNLRLSAFLKLFPKMKIILRGKHRISPIDGIQAIAECMSDEEAWKTFEILKIVFPQYAPKHKE